MFTLEVSHEVDDLSQATMMDLIDQLKLQLLVVSVEVLVRFLDRLRGCVEISPFLCWVPPWYQVRSVHRGSGKTLIRVLSIYIIVSATI